MITSFTKGPHSRVGHTKNLFYNKMNLIHGFGKYNFFGGYRVPLGGSGGTRPPPGWPLWPLSPKAPLEIFLKPLKTFHSNPVKVPRPLVALALAKNLDTAGPRCGSICRDWVALEPTASEEPLRQACRASKSGSAKKTFFN